MVLCHFQIFPVHIKQVLHLHQPAHAEQGGDGLRDRRRKCYAVYAHAEVYDKYQIQDNIQDACHNQIYQCRDRVPQSAQDAAQDIIICKPRRSDEKDVQIRGAPVQNAVRSFQKQQKRPRQHRRHHHDKYGCQSGQYDTVSDRSGQILPVPGAEILRHHDAGPHTDPDKQDDQQVQDRSRASHRRQCIVSYKVAHHHAVHRIVQLLGNITDQHGNRKDQDIFPGLSHRHVNRGK